MVVFLECIDVMAREARIALRDGDDVPESLSDT
jgi:hypothetical protein